LIIPARKALPDPLHNIIISHPGPPKRDIPD